MNAHDELAIRRDALLAAHLRGVRVRVDRIFAALMLVQWLGGIAAASIISPRVWAGGQSAIHIHLIASIVLGGVLAVPCVALVRFRPGETVTRYTIAVCQALFSALLIHLTGGRIETHFHVFVSLAFLAAYREWQLLLVPTAVVAIDHVARGALWPESVFGVAAAAPWRALEHAGWVVFEDIVLCYACIVGMRELRAIATAQAESEMLNDRTDSIVQERTQELVDARQRAEAANRAKSDFLANMSHEIRTPMTAILGFTDILANPDDEDDIDRADIVDTIRSNGQHLMSVINDILDISKIEAGQLTLEILPTSIASIVEDVASLLRPRAVAKGVALDVRYLSDIPRTFESDPIRVRQILMNLVGNAIKFTAQGSVTIEVGCTDAALRVAVVDTGIGMTDAQREKLFTPFTQADETMTRRFGGTGLGLAISLRLAEMMGGSIEVTSEPHRGSTFLVQLPVTGDDLDDLWRPDQRSDTRPRQDLPIASRDGVLASLRILVVDDSADNRNLIQFHLRRAGADVSHATNGREAVEAMTIAGDVDSPVRDPAPFDLILMDMQMPEMDGYQATSRLRALGARLPIVALTAHAMSTHREECLEAGCTDYASKPIDAPKLLEMCARLCAAEQTRHAD